MLRKLGYCRVNATAAPPGPTIEVEVPLHSHSHSHDHGHHGHSHGAGAPKRTLAWSLAATGGFVVFELAAGLKAHSLALVSDAGHNATDALALLLALFAVYLHAKPADESRTYGYHRAGVLAAFVNALALVLLSLWIVFEGWQRLMHPEPVNDSAMLWVAVGAMVLNGSIMLALSASARDDINLRGAFLHMLGDLLGSAAIVIGALVMRATGWTRVDPVLSLLISAMVVWTAWDIIRESLNILLEGLPKGVQLHEVTKAMRKVPGVMDVHDLHIWSIGSNTSALSCHVLIDDMPPSRSDLILHELNHILQDHFKIHHTTVQFEHVGCAISDTGCVLPVSGHIAHHHHHAH
jgi:cobalt-zinc-cadmium efflux system protein